MSSCRSPSASPIRMPGVIEHREQQPVPQPVAGVQDRLHLAGGQHPRQLLRRLQRDRPPRLRLALADVMQERLPAAPRRRRLPGDQQIAEIDTVPGGMLVERANADSFRFIVDSAAVRATDGSTATRPSRPAGGSRSQATNSPTSSSRTSRQSSPRPARKTNQSFRSCAYALTVFGDRSMSLRYARYRSTGATGTSSSPRHRPRLTPRDGRDHPLHQHSSLRRICRPGRPQITTSTTQNPGTPTPRVGHRRRHGRGTPDNDRDHFCDGAFAHQGHQMPGSRAAGNRDGLQTHRFRTARWRPVNALIWSPWSVPRPNSTTANSSNDPSTSPRPNPGRINRNGGRMKHPNPQVLTIPPSAC